MWLRTHGHDFELPINIKFEFNKQNFIVRLCDFACDFQLCCLHFYCIFHMCIKLLLTYLLTNLYTIGEITKAVSDIMLIGEEFVCVC